ncbi:hypothetical protein PsYK624_036990 [Phanerochaete sordida]|uniref:Uncharacterized protein n=1 Tax=Phanerochaete sordida TaxID=48140 RepID=A0A9P3G3N2_9APHY|nr:hypothetical protein PsYK624_036990 [Phanerochaete sordida]
MPDPATNDDDPPTPTSLHRARPSVMTTASGIAESTLTYGSIMSSDGLSRLSQFPPPPSDIPFTPIEAAFAGPSSPVTSDRSMTPTGNTPSGFAASTRRVLPVPPMPLNIQKRSRSPADRAPSPSHADEPGSSASPRFNAPSSKSSYPSPHDWHDGSSSLANDPYGEDVLSTNLITSLLSSVSDTSSQQTAGPSSLKRAKYEPSVVSNALTMESTITYPPPKTFPPPLPNTDYKYPPLPKAFSVQPSPENTIDISSPQALSPPVRSLLPIGGRSTPETWASEESAQTAQQGEAFRSMSVTPSFQSMTSSTPLINTFAKGDPILEEEEPPISGPSTASQSRHSRTRSRRTSTAQSARTTRSYVSSLIGRISHSSGDQRSLKQTTMAWFRGKPLPPVPPMPDHAFREIQKEEQALPLPDLVNRAAVLSSMLDRGHRPYHSTISLGNSKERSMPDTGGHGDVRFSGADPTGAQTARGRKGRSENLSPQSRRGSVGGHDPNPSGMSRRFLPAGRRRLTIVLIVVTLIICIVVAVAVGVTVGEKHTSKHTCPGNLAGATCTLDATCACPTTTSGQCSLLAQSVIDLIPDVSSAFNVNFTAASVATAFWQVQGSPKGSNCAEQADVIDVSDGLDATTFPNRTRWAQMALLWNFVLSENATATGQLQQFVAQADWSSLGSSDGPTADSASKFTTDVAGFRFDFAAQTIVAPPVAFADVGQPTGQQLGQLNAVAEAALDRMSTFALASSTQQKQALTTYWQSVLGQKKSDLTQFLSLIKGAPIMLPFDATAAPGQHNISTLLTNSSSTPFPPPLSCYPGLSSTQLQLTQQLETQVFGLPQASAATIFDPSCYPNRPVYGVLDILQMRLPFTDQRTGVAKQAAILTRDASARAVLYSGELVSAFPGVGTPGPLSTDPRQYGTMSNFDHIILQYLKSFPTVNLAQQVVEYILQSPALPPDSGAQPVLFSSLSQLPIIEVAVFGTVDPSDIASAVSSLSGPQDQVIFGTDASVALRDWAINAVRQGMLWTQLAASQTVVSDTSFANEGFNQIFGVAFTFFHSPNNAVVTVSNITTSFAALNLLQDTGLVTS